MLVAAARLAAVDGRAEGPANMVGGHVGKNRNFKNVPPSAAPTSASRLLVTIKHSLYFPYSFGKENFYEISKT